MIIKKLELHGFKSFPEKTKLMFHTGITAIIGPNGTGKSNIVDALLWVLSGKRLKSLRGENRGDIIFNGNSNKAPMSMADVTLSLAEEDEDIKITHRFFRSGEGEYRLNGKIVRLLDIHDELHKRSVADSDYFVIEQGSITQLITAKPNEKRALLEAAAGTSYYKDKKKQAQNKLENSEQNLIRLEDIISEVEKATNSLKRQAAAAARYRNLREEIRRLTGLNFRRRIYDIEKRQAEVMSGFDNSRNSESALGHRLKDEERNLTDMRKTVWNLEQKIKEEQESLYAQKSRRAKVESDLERDEKNIDHYDDRKKSAGKDDAELNEELKGLEREYSEAQLALVTLEKSLKDKESRLRQSSQDSKKSQEDLEKARKSLESLRRDYLDKISGRTELKNDLARIEKEVELLSRQEEKLGNQIEAQKMSLTDKEKEFASIERQTAKTREILEKTKADITKNRESADKHKILINNLKASLEEKTSIRDRAHHHLQILEKLEEKERAQSLSSEIAECRGLLADHIESDIEYAPLVDIFWKNEITAGIVQPDVFLDSLKENNIEGRFLLRHPKDFSPAASEALKDPRVLAGLKSHVQSQPEFRSHLDFFKEAAVVKDIQTAIALWLEYPEADYITLDGAVLHSSGLIGLGKKKEGLFAISQEIKSLQKKAAALEKEILPLQSRMNGEAENMRAVEQKLQAAHREKERLEKEAAGQEKERDFIASDLEKIRTTREIMEKEQDVLKREKITLEKNRDKIREAMARHEEDESSLQTTLEKEESKLNDLQSVNTVMRRKYFEIKSEIDLIAEKISSHRQRIETIRSRRDNIEAKRSSLKQDMAVSDDEKGKLLDNIRHLKERLRISAKEIKEKETELLENEGLLKQAKEALASEEQTIESLREKTEGQKDDRMQWEVKKAQIERDLVNLEEGCWQELKKNIEEVKKEITLEVIENEDIGESLSDAQEKLQRFSSVNLMAEEEYAVQKERYDFLTKEREDLRESIISTREAIKKIDRESKSLFTEAFDEVNKNFQEVFSILFEGGKAELKLTDPEDLLESGVELSAQPPGKRVQSLGLLSGGEKTLTSLAFFFALFRYKPTPFCILDEVDAALDEINLGRFLNLMKKIKDQTQFIIVTHNFRTMEVADYIYGTTMAEPSYTSVYSVRIDAKTQTITQESKI